MAECKEINTRKPDYQLTLTNKEKNWLEERLDPEKYGIGFEIWDALSDV